MWALPLPLVRPFGGATSPLVAPTPFPPHLRGSLPLVGAHLPLETRTHLFPWPLSGLPLGRGPSSHEELVPLGHSPPSLMDPTTLPPHMPKP